MPDDVTKCPTCESAMEAIGSRVGNWQVFWCLQCGTLKNEGWVPKKCVPRDRQQHEKSKPVR